MSASHFTTCFLDIHFNIIVTSTFRITKFFTSVLSWIRILHFFKITAFLDFAHWSSVKVHRRFRGACCLHYHCNRPETSVNFHKITGRSNSEGCHVHTRRRKTRKFYSIFLVSTSVLYLSLISTFKIRTGWVLTSSQVLCCDWVEAV
jgi:hypothetical protein